MHVRLLTDIPSIANVSEEWMALYRTSGRSPFQNPELLRVWLEQMAPREGCSPLIAAGWSEGRLVAVAPFAVRMQGMIRTLEWAGDAAFDYPDMLLAESVDPRPLWQAVRRSAAYDVARLRHVRTDGVSRPPLAGFATKLGRSEPVFAIEFAHETGAAWLASIQRSMRAEYRDKFRQLTKLGPVCMRPATSPEEIAAAVETLVRFKAAWSRMRGTETVYLSNGMSTYFTELALAAWRERMLHLTTLECAGKPLAAHLGFASHDGFYYYVSSYDVSYAKLSPGRIHMIMLIMWGIDNGMRRFDFLRGEGDYKSKLGVVSRQLDDFAFSHGVIGALALRTYLLRRRGAAPILRRPAAAPVPAGGPRVITTPETV